MRASPGSDATDREDGPFVGPGDGDPAPTDATSLPPSSPDADRRGDAPSSRGDAPPADPRDDRDAGDAPPGPDGETGDTRSPDGCRNVDCDGHGTCETDVLGNPQCNCDPGYVRRNQTRCIAQSCQNVDCDGRGTCEVDANGDPRCNCDSGYVRDGPTSCIPAACQNVGCNGHGTCTVDAQNNALCNCDAGYVREGPETCVSADGDGDGSPRSRDCDDSDPERAPMLDESCDGKDNDCDMQVDENLRRNCSKQQGVCKGVEQVCQNGTWTDCQTSYEANPNYERRETTYDGKDNDCDGQTDEPYMSCYQLDLCARFCGGQRSCIDRTLNKGRGTSRGRSNLDQLLRCSTSNGCDSSRQPYACMKARCSTEFSQCRRNPTGSGLSCSELDRCYANCQQGDQSCQSNCDSRATKRARTTRQNFVDCVNQYCSSATSSIELFTCVGRRCSLQAQKCFGCPL